MGRRLAQSLALGGLLLVMCGLFVSAGKLINYEAYREVSRDWTDQIYEQTYGSGYEQEAATFDEDLEVSLVLFFA